ncbi:MAG: Peroxidase [Marmoricola sp.]|nr:Peroxidase [Marmoricola sp.]
MSKIDKPLGAVGKLAKAPGRLQWHQLPSLTLQLASLSRLRGDLREQNLFESPDIRPEVDLGPATEEARRARTVDGSFNDLSMPTMGMAGTAFGRNVPLRMTTPRPALASPNPRDISNLILARGEFTPAGIINTLAAAWLQFMNHNWFFHVRGSEDEYFEVPLPDGDTWPEDAIRIRKTPTMGCPEGHGGAAPAYANKETHWWDGSQIYGTGAEKQHQMRTFTDGKIKVAADGRLLPDPEVDGIELSGFNENWWAGLSVFHTIFSREHNAICDALKKAYPAMDDQRLFETAWLVNSALMAKIHTVDWTPTILRHPALQIGMYANWWGVEGEALQKKVGRLTGSEVLSGIAGSDAAHHSAPFSLTEEFVSVYRMHPLLPDDYTFISHEDNRVLESRTLTEIQGRDTRGFIDRIGMPDLWYSFGNASAGAVQLHNYPNSLRQLKRIDGEMVDLGTLDILRDRERGIPRYNDFREALRMPRVRSFDELTRNKVWAKEIATLYNNDIDSVDPMVGMYAEQPPKGFGFSDTAFRVFILMASRRIKSDRFFTEDFRPEIYTKLGFDWVQNTTMKDVIERHHPELSPALENVERVFAPWPKVGDTAPEKKNPVAALAETVENYLPFGR